jgi:hypothetical protein
MAHDEQQQSEAAPEPRPPAEPIPSEPDPQLVEWLERGADDDGGEKR